MQTAENRTRYLGSFAVAPLAGAWIEIIITLCPMMFTWVAPLAGAWIEILSKISPAFRLYAVAPLAGAWIEITDTAAPVNNALVAPLAGAWIEIQLESDGMITTERSLPSRERGLK